MQFANHGTPEEMDQTPVTGTIWIQAHWYKSHDLSIGRTATLAVNKSLYTEVAVDCLVHTFTIISRWS